MTSSPDDHGESMETIHHDHLMLNDGRPVDVDNEWTHCVVQCVRKQNTLHVVRRWVTSVALGLLATVICWSDARLRQTVKFMKS